MKNIFGKILCLFLCIGLLFTNTTLMPKAEEGNVDIQAVAVSQEENIKENEEQMEENPVNPERLEMDETIVGVGVPSIDTILENDFSKQIAVGKHNSGYANLGGTYVSWGNETVGMIGGGGSINNTPVYHILPDGEKVKSVEKGFFHTLLLTESGKVFSYGDNEYGQLGNNTKTDSSVPIDLSSYFQGEPIVQISANGWQSFAVTSNGEVYGWGRNQYSQIYGYDSEILTPQLIPSLSNVQKIEAGGYCTFALVTGGHLYAWGYNAKGNLGNGGTYREVYPCDITGSFDGDLITDISAGKQHAMAITNYGRVFIWGYNDHMQVTGDSTNTYYAMPQDITENFPAEEVLHIYAGGNSSGVITIFSAYVWGGNEYGQLGIGSTDNTNYQVDLANHFPAETEITGMALGENHSMYMTNNGKIYTCGENGNGQLGNKTDYNDSYTPIHISDHLLRTGITFFNDLLERNEQILVKDFDQIHYMIAEYHEGEWADNADLSDFLYYSSDESIAEVDQETGQLTMKKGGFADIYAVWRDNAQIINCDFENPKYEGFVVKFPLEILEICTKTETGKYGSFYLTEEGRLYGWGYNAKGQLGNGRTANRNYPMELTNLFSDTILDVQSGYHHTVILTKAGTVYACGDNTYGQIGNGSTEEQLSPAEITGVGEPIKQIRASAWQTFALGYSGRVYSWGRNQYRQLGDGTNTNHSTPTDITSLFGGETVKEIIAGDYCTFALTMSGKIYAWGYGAKGNLGDGTLQSKGTITDITGQFNGETVTELSAGKQHAAAVTSEGNVYVWGYNDKYQLGQTAPQSVSSPQSINHLLGDRTAVRAKASNDVTAVLTSDGKLFVFGNNSQGQLGNGTKVTPEAPLDITQSINGAVASISFGEGHSVVKTEDGKILTAGYNPYGQLGAGNITNSLTFLDITDNLSNYLKSESGETEAEYSMSCQEGLDYMVLIKLDNVPINQREITVTYDSAKLELLDGCGFTENHELQAGAVFNTKITILSHDATSGILKFKYNENMEESQHFSGVVNTILFRPKGSVLANVHVSVSAITENNEGGSEI